MVVEQVGLWGVGLHSGKPCGLTLSGRAGPFTFWCDGVGYTRDQLWVKRTDYGVCLAGRDGFRLDLVEHLFAACAGQGVQDGLEVQVFGPEIPLLDGAAAELGRAIAALGIPASAPTLQVAASGELEVGRSRYRFEPGVAVDLEVEVEFLPFGVERAHWNGEMKAFLSELAVARTFGYRRQQAELRSLGRALAVNPRAVIVLESDGSVLPPGEPPKECELARHKLLDLIGDLYLYGGPPLGRIFASHPGHTNNHRAAKQALAAGLLATRVRDSGH
jgi:UDP-3-O-[3-hydroxymyristoyl] N-acetylglucosamine deacetylase